MPDQDVQYLICKLALKAKLHQFARILLFRYIGSTGASDALLLFDPDASPRFMDVSSAWGITQSNTPARTCVFVDVENDGWLGKLPWLVGPHRNTCIALTLVYDVDFCNN